MPDPLAISWPPRRDVPALSSGEVHVWLLLPPADERRARSLDALLDPAEHARARAFVFPRHRTAFVSAHGQVREVLASYLGMPPEAVELLSAPGGKPRLADRCLAPDRGLRFNLSHSGDAALLAAARDIEVGVDLEVARHVPTSLNIARKHLTGDVVVALERLEGPALDAAFLAAWTRHEALLKAQGAGLFTEKRTGEEGDWQVLQLDIGPALYGAVAFTKGPVRTSTWAWEGPPRPPTDIR